MKCLDILKLKTADMDNKKKQMVTNTIDQFFARCNDKEAAVANNALFEFPYKTGYHFEQLRQIH